LPALLHLPFTNHSRQTDKLVWSFRTVELLQLTWPLQSTHLNQSPSTDRSSFQSTTAYGTGRFTVKLEALYVPPRRRLDIVVSSRRRKLFVDFNHVRSRLVLCSSFDYSPDDSPLSVDVAFI